MKMTLKWDEKTQHYFMLKLSIEIVPVCFGPKSKPTVLQMKIITTYEKLLHTLLPLFVLSKQSKETVQALAQKIGRKTQRQAFS